MLSSGSPTWQSSLLASVLPRRSSRGASTSEGLGNATLIAPRLYLSDLFTARSEAELTRLGITHVLSVLDHQPTLPAHLTKLYVPLADRSDVDILCHLDTTTAFIRDALAESADNTVLVHCFMGISRSATAVCAFLIATTDMTAPQALAAVKAKRPVVNPNFGFQRQLRTYAEKYRGPDWSGEDGRNRTVSERSRMLRIKEDVMVSVAAVDTIETPARTMNTAAEVHA